MRALAERGVKILLAIVCGAVPAPLAAQVANSNGELQDIADRLRNGERAPVVFAAAWSPEAVAAVAADVQQTLESLRGNTLDPDAVKAVGRKALARLEPLLADPDLSNLEIWRLAALAAHALDDDLLATYAFEALGRLSTPPDEARLKPVMEMLEGRVLRPHLDMASSFRRSLALMWELSALEDNTANTWYAMGGCYKNGNGVPRCPSFAAICFTVAADLGHAGAMAEIGAALESGRGVEPAFSSALEWYHKGAAAGNAECKAQLGLYMLDGRVLERDEARAHQLLLEAERDGSALAAWALGDACEKGKGVAQDYAAAAEHFVIAVERGHTLAMLRLARLHDEGLGIPRDQAKAVQLWTEAGSRGELMGWTRVSMALMQGQGTERDIPRGLALLKKTAKAGEPWAMDLLATLYFDGDLLVKDDEQAAYWWDRAEALGHRPTGRPQGGGKP